MRLLICNKCGVETKNGDDWYSVYIYREEEKRSFNLCPRCGGDFLEATPSNENDVV